LLPKRFQAIASRKRSSIALELDVRGTRALEAVERVDKYLDDAVLAGLERVVIIHGKGTGALRHALHEHLASHPHVDGYRLGAHDEGDAGVTVIQLAG
jgi:DNA mismatch repair protein MutS2